MILQVFWQLCTKTPPSKLHWIYTHLIPCLQSRDRILPLRPFQLLQLVHAKLPLIICGDNKWQGEKPNRTSDNYRLWEGDCCTADKKKIPTAQNCAEPLQTAIFPNQRQWKHRSCCYDPCWVHIYKPGATASVLHRHSRKNDARSGISAHSV